MKLWSCFGSYLETQTVKDIDVSSKRARKAIKLKLGLFVRTTLPLPRIMSTVSSSPTRTTKPKQVFVGRLQPSGPRLPGKPPVDYAKGGDDFRCFARSSLGKQVLSQARSTGSVPITSAARFGKSDTVGVGPNLGPMSSFGFQKTSNRRTSGVVSFGTSTRDGALKLYAVYTCKK